MLNIKKVFWKKLLIIEIIPWNVVFTMNVEKWKWIPAEHVIYIRKNGADQQIKDPLELIEFTKNKFSNSINSLK